MIVTRFRVATRATGVRRQVYVHVYDDRQQMARAHEEAHGRTYDPAADVPPNEMGGGMTAETHGGFPWPKPDPGPVLVIRLWTGQLTIRTVAHEATHAASFMHFMDSMRGWDSRARDVLSGNNEPLCYAVGDITEAILEQLHRRELLAD